MLTKQQVLENLEQTKKYIEEIENSKIQEKKKINITIKNRWTGSIIFESEKTTYREAIEEAISTRANLTGADLARANLTGADLARANLTDANLADADLARANLTDANLARANLTDANLADADLTGADLTGADLTGADLTGANLARANLTGCLYYFGAGNRNFEALCKVIKTIKHQDGKFEDFNK